MALTLALCLYSYLAVRAGARFPLIDNWLDACDQVLGFDWKAYLQFFDGLPHVSNLLGEIYFSLYWQGLFIVIVLTATGRFMRLQQLVLAFALAGIACGVISAVMPAVGAYSFLQLGPADHPHILLGTGDAHVPGYLALRAGTFSMFSFDHASGIVTFPSFHTTLLVLITWSLWPVRGVKWLIASLNGLMAFAIPLHGSHYVTDMVAGALLAAAAIAVTHACHALIARRGGLAAAQARPA